MKDDINMDEQGQMSSDMETLLGTICYSVKITIE